MTACIPNTYTGRERSSEKTLVSITSPRPSFEEARAFGVRAIWFVVRPNRDQLIQIASLIDEGYVRPVIDTVLPLSQARQAYEYGAKGHTRGKIVLRVVEQESR